MIDKARCAKHVSNSSLIKFRTKTIRKEKVHQKKITLCRVLPTEQKLEFVKASVAWIQGKDNMDSCFILNYGYEAPLPWPQVKMGKYEWFIKVLVGKDDT